MPEQRRRKLTTKIKREEAPNFAWVFVAFIGHDVVIEALAFFS
jgi:hypothetical protein